MVEKQQYRFSWPIHAFPIIHHSGRFRLADSDFSFRYRLPRTHVLHLHDYVGRVRLGEQAFTLSPGDATITPAGVPSWYDLREPGWHLCLHFSLGDRQPEATPRTPTVDLPLRRSATEARLIREAVELSTLGDRDPVSRALASLALQRALLRLASPPTDDPVVRVAMLIDSQLDRPKTTRQLAREVERSPNYLARQFRERFGCTMQRYLRDRRINHARLLLRTTNVPIKTIGARVGLPDPQHFNKTFRASVGQSPSTFRAKTQSSGDLSNAAAKDH